MISRRFLLLALTAGASCATASAYAQQPVASGFYIGGGLGKSDIKLDSADFDLSGASQQRDESDTAWKLFAGYHFSRNFGAEVMYADLGNASVTYTAGPAGSVGIDYEATSWALAATARFPVGPLSVLGRLGAARNEARINIGSASGALGAFLTTAGFGPGSGTSKTRTSLYWGLGAQYDFVRNFGVRLDYDNFGKFGNEEDTGRAKGDMLSISAVVRF